MTKGMICYGICKHRCKEAIGTMMGNYYGCIYGKLLQMMIMYFNGNVGSFMEVLFMECVYPAISRRDKEIPESWSVEFSDVEGEAVSS